MRRNLDGKQSWFPAAIEIFALTNLAIAQPLFNVLARGPEFFLVRRNLPSEIFIFVLAVALGLPFCLWLIEQIVGILGPASKEYFHEFLICVLSAVILLTFFKNVRFLPDLAKFAISSVFGILVILLRKRASSLKSFFLFLAPAIVAVSAIFLTSPAIGKIVSSERPAIPIYKINATAPVVIFVLDEFPLSVLLNSERGLNCSRFPNFCKFAKTATWFRSASSISDRTQEAVTGLLTGRYPSQDSLPTVFDHPENLFTLLNSAYDMNVHETLTSLNPAGVGANRQERLSFMENERGMIADAVAVYLQTVLPPSSAARFPSVAQTWSAFWNNGNRPKSEEQKDAGRGESLERYINAIQNPGRPVFIYYHVVLPHGPWQYLPTGSSYNFARHAQPSTEDRGQGWGDEVTADRALQRLLLQTGYVDRKIGRVMERLREIDLFDSAIIVLTGDHGISFVAGDERRILTKSNYSDILSIPLFIKEPNQKSDAVSDLPVELIDVLPSIATSLNISIPWKVDGQSALNENYNPRPTRRAFQWLHQRGMAWEFKDFGTFRNAKKIQSLFGADRPFDAAFFCGPFVDLSGRSVHDFQVRAQRPIYSLESPELFENIDLKSGFVPALITGRIQAANRKVGKTWLAATINGIVRGTARTFPVDNSNHGFAIMVPEESFVSGKNIVEVWEIIGKESELR